MPFFFFVVSLPFYTSPWYLKSHFLPSIVCSRISCGFFGRGFGFFWWRLSYLLLNPDVVNVFVRTVLLIMLLTCWAARKINLN